MKQTRHIFFVIGLVTATMAGCKKPYAPPVIASRANYLVVEGLINPGSDSTIIKLSRTVPLSSTSSISPELNASVVIESNTNATYPLTAAGNGRYVAVGLNLNTSNNYRLDIRTSDNKTYQSDFVRVKNAPPIDSISFLVKSNGIQINSNSHDPLNSTTYYRYEYAETWVIQSAFESFEKLVTTPSDTIIPRPFNENIYVCWQNAQSSDIVLGSTAKLSSDILANNPITFINSTDEKISHRYSILLKQYALTKSAFDYWQQLKKNTEQLGGIFDPQPSELPGNIHCISTPSVQVIGYITAGTVAQKRIFIDNSVLPAWRAITPNDGCKIDTSLFVYYPPLSKTPINQVALFLYTNDQMPLYALVRPMSSIVIGYTQSSHICVDCTLRGTKQQPAFWISQ